jgi:hypothetical protein
MDDMTEPATTVRKYGARLPVTRQNLLDLQLVKPTSAEQREMDNARADLNRRTSAATEAWPGFVAALDAVTDPVGRAVLDLHANRDGDCGGCAFNGYEAEPDAWPCPTTTLVAEKLGIRVPPDLDMAEQARRW